MKPPFKWVGGKRRLVPQIKELMPKQYYRYHEPFLGGGALFFDLNPEYSYISDVNQHLINAYLGIRSQPEKVINHLKQFTYDRKVFEAVRWFNFERGELAQQAADFIYCNKVGFNGLYRVNRNGKYNVPFGAYTNPNWCNEENIKEASVKLMNANIICQSFKESSKFVDEGDFVYFDPPYIPLTATSDFTSYTKDGFDIEHQTDLRDIAVELKNKGAHVILSNSSSPLVYKLYQKTNFKIKEVQSLRSINSNGSKRGAVTELLIY